jgi:hypothetical protein
MESKFFLSGWLLICQLIRYQIPLTSYTKLFPLEIELFSNQELSSVDAKAKILSLKGLNDFT